MSIVTSISKPSLEEDKKKRRRQALSCEYCRRRRVRCDRQPQCSSCTSRGRECVWEDGVVPTGSTSSEVEDLKREVAYLKAQLLKRDRELEKVRQSIKTKSSNARNVDKTSSSSSTCLPTPPPQSDGGRSSSHSFNSSNEFSPSPSPSTSPCNFIQNFPSIQPDGYQSLLTAPSNSHFQQQNPHLTAQMSSINPSIQSSTSSNLFSQPLMDFFSTLGNQPHPPPVYIDNPNLHNHGFDNGRSNLNQQFGFISQL